MAKQTISYKVVLELSKEIDDSAVAGIVEVDEEKMTIAEAERTKESNTKLLMAEAERLGAPLENTFKAVMENMADIGFRPESVHIATKRLHPLERLNGLLEMVARAVAGKADIQIHEIVGNCADCPAKDECKDNSCKKEDEPATAQ